MSAPTFTAMVRAVQEHRGVTQCGARRLTRDYLNGAKEPSLDALIVYVDVMATGSPIRGMHRDPTGEKVANNLQSGRTSLGTLSDRHGRAGLHSPKETPPCPHPTY